MTAQEQIQFENNVNDTQLKISAMEELVFDEHISLDEGILLLNLFFNSDVAA